MLRPQSCSAPITALCLVPLQDDGRSLSSRWLLAGQATRLLLADTRPRRTATRSWTVLDRDRIHRIIINKRQGQHLELLVLGGKEAAFVQLDLAQDGDIESCSLQVMQRISFPDWIHDGTFTSASQCAFVSAHNSILSYELDQDRSSWKLIDTLDAPLRPLLWGARFSRSRFDDRASVTVAGGSMLGDVLLWRPFSSTTSVAAGSTITRYKGHQGSIYSVAFSPSGKLLASISDDRTVRIWDSSARTIEASDGVQEAPDVVTIWGHEGRIWRVEWMDESTLATCGEDASCIVWSIDLGRQVSRRLHTFRGGHDGRSIWSLATWTSGVITGGADGGIRNWNVQDSGGRTGQDSLNIETGLQTKTRLKGLCAADSPTGSRIAVLHSNDGCIHLVRDMNKSNMTTQKLLQSPLLQTAVVLTLPDHNHAWAFTNRDHAFKVSLDGSAPYVVHYSTGISANKVLVDDDAQVALIFDRQRFTLNLVSMALESEMKLLARVGMPESLRPTQRHVLAFAWLSNDKRLVLVGNAEGDLVLYRLDGDEDETLLTLERVAESSVTDLHVEQANGESFHVESISEDGHVRSHRIRKEASNWTISTTSETKLHKGGLTQIYDTASERLYLGSSGTQAVVLDRSGHKLHTFTSPGRHVPYQLVVNSESTSYFRLNSGKLHVQTTAVSAGTRPVIVPGRHGRETRSVKLVGLARPAAPPITLMATGAENSIVRIAQVEPDRLPASLFSAKLDAATVKTVEWARSPQQDCLYLFASGGGDRVQAWHVQVAASGNESRVDVRSAGSCGTVSDDVAAVRAMDMTVVPVELERPFLAVSLAFSDGTIKMWLYDPATRAYCIVAATTECEPCLLSLKHVSFQSGDVRRHLLIAGASDGRLSMFDATEALTTDRSATQALPRVLSRQVHQSGINGLDVWHDDATEFVIASSGDDNAIHVGTYRAIGGDVNLVKASVQASAHASTIQGLKFVARDFIVSSAVDQRVNVYRINDDDMRIVDSAVSSVCDCSAMDVCGSSRDRVFAVAVAGIGEQVFELTVPKF
ncbi:hypothetical protein ACM66B_000461 [Microbotryomycetes sp. NB124-2]